MCNCRSRPIEHQYQRGKACFQRERGGGENEDARRAVRQTLTIMIIHARVRVQGLPVQCRAPTIRNPIRDGQPLAAKVCNRARAQRLRRKRSGLAHGQRKGERDIGVLHREIVSAPCPVARERRPFSLSTLARTWRTSLLLAPPHHLGMCSELSGRALSRAADRSQVHLRQSE